MTPREERDQSRYAWLVRVETVALLLVLALAILIAVVSIYYEQDRIFTNAGFIVVIAATLGELTRRARHVATDPRLRRGLKKEDPP